MKKYPGRVGIEIKRRGHYCQRPECSKYQGDTCYDRSYPKVARKLVFFSDEDNGDHKTDNGIGIHDDIVLSYPSKRSLRISDQHIEGQDHIFKEHKESQAHDDLIESGEFLLRPYEGAPEEPKGVKYTV